MEELIPGVPNDIFFCEIVTKFSALNIRGLSSLGPAWTHAVESRQIYNARVCFHSTEKLAVFRVDSIRNGWGIYLFSLREKRLSQVSGVPNLGNLWSTRVLALDGKLYLLGGTSVSFPQMASKMDYRRMYVLDLAAGDMVWHQCASMLKPRLTFVGCAANGKLYIFGGTSRDGEVYDPEVDVWSPIKGMVYDRFFRCPYNVTAVGEELFVAGSAEFVSEGSRKTALSWKVYNPLKDEWRQEGPRVSRDRSECEQDLYYLHPERAFVAQGKFFSISNDVIHVYHTELKAWQLWSSMTYEGLGFRDTLNGNPQVILSDNNELLAAVNYTRKENDSGIQFSSSQGWSLLQSSGFSRNSSEFSSNKSRQIVWSETHMAAEDERLLFGNLNCPDFPFRNIEMCFVDV